MNILITGVAGLLGSNIARSLSNHNIIGVDNLVGGYIDNIPSEIKWVNKDCNDLTKEDFKDIEVVIHAACTAHEGLSVCIHIKHGKIWYARYSSVYRKYDS
jgi:UDP-glucose 4-epimerase